MTLSRFSPVRFTLSSVKDPSGLGCLLPQGSRRRFSNLFSTAPMFATRRCISRCNSSRLSSSVSAGLPRFGIRAGTRSNLSSSSSTPSVTSTLKTPNPLPRLVLFATLGGIAGVVIASTLSPTKASELVEGKPLIKYKYASPSEAQKAIEELKGIFSDKGRVLSDQETLETYGYSPNSYHHAAPHSVVVRVFSTEDVVKVVNVARKWRMPVTAYSGGTSLEGHFGGVSIPLMNEIISDTLYSTITKVLLVASA